MPQLNPVALATRPSGIRYISQMANKMENILHLGIGEPQFDTPEHIVEAGCKAIRDGWTKYLNSAGIEPLRGAISKQLNDDYGFNLKNENIVLTTGGVEAIYTSIRITCNGGDSLLMPDPCWPNVEMIAQICNIEMLRYGLKAENGYLPNIDELESLVKPNTKALYINSPSNPLGCVFPKETMKQIYDFAKKHDLFIISDEVYHKLVYGDREHSSPMSYDTDGRVIIVGAMSKTYAMTGWRVGYAAGNKEAIDTIIKLQESCISSVPGFCQWASVAAYEGPQDIVDTMREAYRKNAEVAKSILKEYGIEHTDPSGAFYLWINAECEDSYQFCIDCLHDIQVAVAPGEAFGPSNQNYVRASLASAPEVVDEGLRRLAKYIISRRNK